MDNKKFDVIIGIEVHAQLNTKNKLFSVCKNSSSDIPNTNINAVTAALPGWYPILNRACIYKACKFGASINGNINNFSRFSRKCYFYPDNPKNFQITQDKYPIVSGGRIHLISNGESKYVDIDRIQLEEDTAITKNFGAISGINLNRAGSPLIEIVSTPSIYSVKDAVNFAKTIRQILIINNISNGNLEDGEIRFDCNISIKKIGEEKLGNRYEIKNLNSFCKMEESLNKAIQDQAVLLESGKEVKEQTYKWNAESKILEPMRDKMTNFYGYFDEVDIPSIAIEQSFIDKISKEIVEDPGNRILRFMNKYNFDEQDSRTAILSYNTADLIEKLINNGINPKEAFSWVCVESKRILNSKQITVGLEETVSWHNILTLIQNVQSGKITRYTAKELLEKVVDGLISNLNDYILENEGTLSSTSVQNISDEIDSLFIEFPDSVDKILKGNDRPIKFFIGSVIGKFKGKCDPEVVKSIIIQKIKNMSK